MAGSRIPVGPDDMPVTCPPETEWNKHPRVCIPFPQGQTESICPYCGNRFVLRDRDEDTNKKGKTAEEKK